MSISRTRWWLASVLVATFALAGCGGSQHDSAASSGSNAKAPGPAAGGVGDAPLDKEGAGAGPPAQQNGQAPAQVPDNLPDTRSIIYTGTISLRVPKVDDAALKVSAAAEQAGGFVGGEDRSSESGDASAKMTLRVPAAKFTGVLNSLRALVGGTELSRQVSTEDVTEQVADVDARLANAQASVDRIRALMAKAQTIGEITSLEAELSRREGDLESLQARKRKLDDVTALSTITVLLFAPPAPVDKPNKPAAKGFLAGLKAGWSSFVSAMQVLLTVIGVLLPWLAALAIVGLLVWLPIRRALRRRPPRPVAMAMATPGPAPAPAPTMAPATAPAPAAAPTMAPTMAPPAAERAEAGPPTS